MSAEHTLRIRCPTWDHLENFYERKVKDDRTLLARVPFSPAIGSQVTIALELPDGLTIDVGARVEGVRKAPDGRKSAIRMILSGMDEGLRARLRQAVQEGRHGGKRARPLSEAPPVEPRTQTGLPVPIPLDAPIDEVVPVVALPDAGELPEAVRERYLEFEESLRALREKAAHDVLGVAWDADVVAIRAAYFQLVKRYHPDVVARYESPAISLLVSEIFIYINKAYDRLRDSAIAAGRAIAAGPALLPHQGWLADFDDIGTVKPRRPLRSDDLSVPVSAPGSTAESLPLKAPEEREDVQVRFSAAEPEPEPAETPALTKLPTQELFSEARRTRSGQRPLQEEEEQEPVGADADAGAEAEELLTESKELLAAGSFEEARERLAVALELQPRNRRARAQYHAAYGHTLLARGKEVAAMTQFEVALKHDPDCELAASARAKRKPGRTHRPSLFKRLFRR